MATTALLILDGFGIGKPDPKSNAIYAQGTPNIDALKAKYSHTAIGASGLDVGLPDGQMGNSEVGHTNIGAGRVVYQMLVKITKDIQDGVFFENKALLAAMDNCGKERFRAAPDRSGLPRRRTFPYRAPVRSARNGEEAWAEKGLRARAARWTRRAAGYRLAVCVRARK